MTCTDDLWCQPLDWSLKYARRGAMGQVWYFGSCHLPAQRYSPGWIFLFQKHVDFACCRLWLATGAAGAECNLEIRCCTFRSAQGGLSPKDGCHSSGRAAGCGLAQVLFNKLIYAVCRWIHSHLSFFFFFKLFLPSESNKHGLLGAWLVALITQSPHCIAGETRYPAVPRIT